MGLQDTQKYIPVEYSREKNTYVEEYFSGADVEITINDDNIDYINAIQYSINEQLKPIYGYQSRTYDNIAVGTRLVTGIIKVPTKNNASNHLEDYRKKVPTLLTEDEVRNGRPSWIMDSSILADVYEKKEVKEKIVIGKLVSSCYIFLEPYLKTIITKYNSGLSVYILKELDNCYLVKINDIAGYVSKKCVRKNKEV